MFSQTRAVAERRARAAASTRLVGSKGSTGAGWERAAAQYWIFRAGARARNLSGRIPLIFRGWGAADQGRCDIVSVVDPLSKFCDGGWKCSPVETDVNLYQGSFEDLCSPSIREDVAHDASSIYIILFPICVNFYGPFSLLTSFPPTLIWVVSL